MRQPTKQAIYDDIVRDRKACRKCDGVYNPAVIADGVFDSGEVGSWTGWQGNLDSDLMIIGQDWGGHEYFEKFRGKEKDNNPTNVLLREFLHQVGREIELPEHSTGRGELYFTNAMLCCREGLLTENASTGTKPVKSVWFRKCEPLLRAQIEVVNPKVIVTLGYYAYRSVLCTFGLKPRARMRDAVSQPELAVVGRSSVVVPVYHCGNNGRRSRTIQLQQLDWDRVRRVLTPAQSGPDAG